MPLEGAKKTTEWHIGRWIHNTLQRLDGRRCRLNGGVKEMRDFDVKKLQHLRDIQAYAVQYYGPNYLPQRGDLFISKQMNGLYKCKTCLNTFIKEQVIYNRCETCRLDITLVRDRRRKQKNADYQKDKKKRLLLTSNFRSVPNLTSSSYLNLGQELVG